MQVAAEIDRAIWGRGILRRPGAHYRCQARGPSTIAQALGLTEILRAGHPRQPKGLFAEQILAAFA